MRINDYNRQQTEKATILIDVFITKTERHVPFYYSGPMSYAALFTFLN
jgi:hypothetical protein